MFPLVFIFIFDSGLPYNVELSGKFYDCIYFFAYINIYLLN